MRVREQSLSRGASQSAVRRRWLSCVLCDRRIQQFLPFQQRFQLCGKPEVASSQVCAVRGLTDLDDAIFCQKKSLHERCRMGRRIDADSLICWLGHCECYGHTVHKLSQRRLTADWLAPRESDCSRMRSKVSTDWLPRYIKATRPVLEIFKMAV